MHPALDYPSIVLDTIPEAYVCLDSDFRFTFVNRAALPLFGKMPAEIVGRELWDVYPSSRGTPLELGCRRAMAERMMVTTQHCFEPSQTCHSITVMPNSQGGLCVKFSELSERQQMEDAQQKSEEKFSKAFRSSPVPMCIVDIDQNYCFLDVNEAFERVSGYQREEIVGRTASEIGFFGDPQIMEEGKRRLLEEGGYRHLEARFYKKSGDLAICLVSSERITLNGNFCAISGAIDITDRRQAVQALQESEELYRRLFEVEPDALLLVDLESGQILAANAAASTLYGYDREELLSMNGFDLSAEPEQTVQARIELPTFIPLRWHRRKDGTILPVDGFQLLFRAAGPLSLSQCHYSF